jgi:hypothetical protein
MSAFEFAIAQAKNPLFFLTSGERSELLRIHDAAIGEVTGVALLFLFETQFPLPFGPYNHGRV